MSGFEGKQAKTHTNIPKKGRLLKTTYWTLKAGHTTHMFSAVYFFSICVVALLQDKNAAVDYQKRPTYIWMGPSVQCHWKSMRENSAHPPKAGK